ncbi:extracellular matrix regulator RemB [uncultured Subdoligranulum sp.]|uniref:extracellular matrix regulator RemB n=1 Tax=uncultured Subdoligranulum sp. TaxID=512298 RepID=UPI0025D6C8A1|nr:extracellular matrix/biofilm biosynthesis regulator RemA family protein [uncultured Subdoligranulum sp.]
MLIHLGQDFVVRDREILGVFDLDTATDAGQKEKLTDAFLRRAQREGAVVDVSGAMPKSFVLTDFAGETVYITQLSTGALRRRAHNF